MQSSILKVGEISESVFNLAQSSTETRTQSLTDSDGAELKIPPEIFSPLLYLLKG